MFHDVPAKSSRFACAMDHRAPLGATQRPRPPQRAVSGGSYGSSQLPKRPTLPSRLSSVRSASQPSDIVDLTSDGTNSNELAFLGNREKLVGSPDVINLEDDDGEPPAKRMKTMGDGFRGTHDGTDSRERDKAHGVVPGSALPNLPKTKPSTKRIAPTRRHRFGIEPAARKAHGIDPPAIATILPPPKKTADFSPWTGSHLEDVMNETVIKAGYFDKGQSANQSESNSAKASIWPNLSQKNHHGLQMLGYLFMAVVDKRQVMGRVTAPSTFKPPPRVTVTDTKREAWLRDLANPEVPLRKQSRTIPHGIRGKLLMEQCLSKDIPLQRAVWLAKCVGAKEMRAFSRKGVSGSTAASGELKWVREWTVHIEQFLEGVIATCGQVEDWQQKMNYAVKLATAFYAESLLDADHYLDWIVSSLFEAPLERLPVWIVMMQIYWKSITMYGRRGRKLAEALLEHLHQITQADLEVNAALKLRLQKLISVLATTSRGSFIIPHAWENYKYLLAPKTGTTATDTPAHNIAERNERLASPLYKTAVNTRSLLLDLYNELETIGLDVDIDTLLGRCSTLIPNVSKLVSALLDWASTPYRPGITRIYLVSRVIAHLHDACIDTDAIILNYISDAKALTKPSTVPVHKVVVDLVRLESFSVGRYLQWLITSGAMSSAEPDCATSLIATLPTTSLPLHVANTRKTLMSRLGYAADESTLIDRVLARIDNTISRSETEHVEPVEFPEGLTISETFNVSQKLCRTLSILAKDVGIGFGTFTVARDVLERVGDIASLATLIQSASSTGNAALLATLSDSVNLHAESFAALGRLTSLVDDLTEQYIHLRSQQPLDRTLILALTGLVGRVPDKAPFVRLLNGDLVICEQQNSVAVCSPASDSLIGMTAWSLDSENDIDEVFASGNSMDEQLMQRVFMRIMQRALKPVPPGPEPVSRVGGWLNQLRSVDTSGGFDQLVQNHLRNSLKSPATSSTALRVITSLVSSGCITLGAVADIAKEIKTSQAAAGILRAFISETIVDTGLHNSEIYRYRLQQARCQVEHTNSLITLIIAACEAPGFTVDDPDLVRFAIRSFCARPESILRIFEDATRSTAVVASVGRMVNTILQCERGTAEESRDLDLRSIINMANPLSLLYCVGTIRYFKSMPTFSSDDESVLADSILASFASQSEVWPQLLETAGSVVNKAIHEWAQDQLLVLASYEEGMQKQGKHGQLERHLDLLAVTKQAADHGDSTNVLITITEKLKCMERRVSELDSFKADSNVEVADLLYGIRIMLQLCTMHVHALPGESDGSRQARCDLLTALCTLLVHPKLQTYQDLVEYLFDLSSTLSDQLPDFAQTLQKLLSTGKLPLDARLTSVLGSNTSAVDSWLALASQVHPAGSQQQRALNKHPSQQSQMSARPQMSGQAQQSSAQQHQHQHHRWLSQSGHPNPFRQDNRVPGDTKRTAFPLRRWEIMPDSTPSMGENDSSLSLGLFGARKV